MLKSILIIVLSGFTNIAMAMASTAVIGANGDLFKVSKSGTMVDMYTTQGYVGDNYLIDAINGVWALDTNLQLIDTKYKTKGFVAGGSYFVESDTNRIIAITSDNAAVDTGQLLPKDAVIGGNFYVSSGVVYSISASGVASSTNKNVSGSYSVGGNFIIDSTGHVFAFPSKGGFVDAGLKVNSQAIAAGNFIIDKNSEIYAILADATNGKYYVDTKGKVGQGFYVGSNFIIGAAKLKIFAITAAGRFMDTGAMAQSGDYLQQFPYHQTP